MLLELGVPFNRSVAKILAVSFENLTSFVLLFIKEIYATCNPHGHILVWHFDLHVIWMSLWDILLYNMVSFKKNPSTFYQKDQLNETGSF